MTRPAGRPTVAQLRILRSIAAFQAQHGYPPTYDEIAAGAGLRSKGSVHTSLLLLVDRGYLAERPSRRALWRICVDLEPAARLAEAVR